MNKGMIYSIIVIVIIIGLVLLGQSLLKQPATGQEAVQKSKTIETVAGQRDYLIKQAKRFMQMKDLKTAMDLSQYILVKVDKNSTGAKELLSKIQNAVAVQKQRMSLQ